MGEKPKVKYVVIRHYDRSTITSYSNNIGKGQSLKDALNEMLDNDAYKVDCRRITVRQELEK